MPQTIEIRDGGTLDYDEAFLAKDEAVSEARAERACAIVHGADLGVSDERPERTLARRKRTARTAQGGEGWHCGSRISSRGLILHL